MKIIIIDTACANLASLKFCLDRLGFNATISRDLKELESADKLFLPGVGTAKEAMKNLEQFNLIDFIQNTKKPLLGICLGMQILGNFSEELNQETLKLIDFTTQKFKAKEGFTFPHMGWNELILTQDHPLMKNIKNGDYVYFVHSYMAYPTDDELIACCEYGQAKITAVVAKDHVMGCQFHPEKSGAVGRKILLAFKEMVQ